MPNASAPGQCNPLARKVIGAGLKKIRICSFLPGARRRSILSQQTRSAVRWISQQLAAWWRAETPTPLGMIQFLENSRNCTLKAEKIRVFFTKTRLKTLKFALKLHSREEIFRGATPIRTGRWSRFGRARKSLFLAGQFFLQSPHFTEEIEGFFSRFAIQF